MSAINPNRPSMVAIVATLLFHSVVVAGLWSSDQLASRVEREFRTDQIIIQATLMTFDQVMAKSESRNITDLVEQKRQREQKLRAQQHKQQQEKLRIQDEAKALEAEKKRIEQAELQQQQQEQALENQKLEHSLFESALEQDRVAIQQSGIEQQMLSYEQYVYRQIRQQWIRPHSARNGMAVLLEVNMVPTGYVNTVNVVRSSGNDGFDRSAVQAVKKAAPYKELSELTASDFNRHFRNFNVLFNPIDLRQ